MPGFPLPSFPMPACFPTAHIPPFGVSAGAPRLAPRWSAVRGTVFVAVLVAVWPLHLFSVAAPRSSAAWADEPPLAEQVAAVRGGTATRIRVSGGPLTEAEWEEVTALETLAHLDCQEGIADDARAAQLARLPRLERLALRHSPLTDEGLGHLATCRSLRALNLPQARCTRAGIDALAALPHLTSLRLGSPLLVASAAPAAGAANAARDEEGRDTTPPVSEDGSVEEGRALARTLLRLASLRTLHLVDVPLGDEGLDILADHDGLRTLYLDGAGISDAAWERYFARRPGVHVHVDQAHHDRDPNRHD